MEWSGLKGRHGIVGGAWLAALLAVGCGKGCVVPIDVGENVCASDGECEEGSLCDVGRGLSFSDAIERHILIPYSDFQKRLQG